jgi:transposase
MLYLTQETQVLLAVEPVNFRKQIDGLVALCEQALFINPRSGQLFVFINRARTMIRILCYEQGGYWLATKRLSRGRYNLWPNNRGQVSHQLLAADLTKLLKTYIAPPNKIRYFAGPKSECTA